MTTASPPPDRRRDILDAALACFLDRGYAATSIADIRARSGASTGSIYHFFSGKGALAAALLQLAVSGWSKASSLSADASPEAAIKASVTGLILWALSDPAQFRFMDEIRTLASTDPDFAEVRQALTAGQAASAAHFAAMQQAGAVRDLPWPVAHSLMLGPAYNYLRLAPPDQAPEATAALFADAAWAAVRA